MIYLIKRSEGNCIFWILVFSLLTTLFEYCAVLTGIVKYGKVMGGI